MFNPETNLKPAEIWDFLGTFYSNLSLEEKAKIEMYWKALSDGVLTQHFNLYQENISQFLSLTEGWHESEGQELDICYKDELDLDRVNVKKEFLEKPSGLTASYPTTSVTANKKTYAYRITAINDQGETLPSSEIVVVVDSTKVFSTRSIVLQWSSVFGATGYNIYGRTHGNYNFIATATESHYVDMGIPSTSKSYPYKNTAVKGYLYKLSDDDFYLTIPKLFTPTGSELIEGINYELVEGRKIRFLLPLDVDTDNLQSKIGNSYTVSGGIKILPSLDHIYFPAYNTSMKRIIEGGYYKPHLKDWDTWGNEEKQKARAKHLKDLIWGYSVLTRRDPNTSTLKQSMALAYDYPFSYEDGEVTDITGRYVTISGVRDYTYDLGDGVHPLVGVSDQVKRFDILASGINIYDYNSHPQLIESLNTGSYTDKINETLTTEAENEALPFELYNDQLRLTQPIDPAFLIKLESTSLYKPDPKLQENFKKITIPAGLIAIE